MAVQEIVRRHGLRVGVVPSGGRLNFGRWLTSVRFQAQPVARGVGSRMWRRAPY